MGHCAPYTAVIALSAMAAHHWRSVRLKLVLAGISDPMGMPSMHLLLDTIEALILESMQSSDPRADARQRTSFLDKIYQPAPADAKELNGNGYKPAPAGFDSPEDVEASFDAFMIAAR